MRADRLVDVRYPGLAATYFSTADRYVWPVSATFRSEESPTNEDPDVSDDLGVYHETSTNSQVMNLNFSSFC